MDRAFLIATGVGSALMFGVVWVAAASRAPAPTQVADRSAPARPAAADAPAVVYAGCNEARAAGAAPLYRGQPGYRSDMDGDDDGVACEPHREQASSDGDIRPDDRVPRLVR